MTRLRHIEMLLAQVTLYCTNAGGRFGEDKCHECPACKLRKLVPHK